MKLKVFEIGRSVIHILAGTLIILLSIKFRPFISWILLAALIVGILLSILSLKFKIPLIYQLLKTFEKPKYMKIFPGKGVLFFVAGCLLVLKIFSQQFNIAIAAIAILTFGDSISHIVGISIGKINHKSPFSEFKKVEGTLFGILAAFIAASFFVKPVYALIASAIAMFAEALTLRLGGDNVDDNMVIPIIGGTIIYLLTLFIG